MNSKIKYLVYGLGKSGNAAIELLKLIGTDPTEILAFDDSMDESVLDPALKQSESGELVLSPGVPIAHARVQKLLKRGWNLTSEINLACSQLNDEKIIGITGSVGKSTVTSLIGAAALHFDPNSFVGGNLGVPFAQYALDILKGRTRAQWIILELSSYQLENCNALNLNHSVITYFAPNHLERYQSLEHYYDTKFSICAKTQGFVFLNSKSQELMSRLNRVTLAGKTPNWLPTNFNDDSLIRSASEMKLWGKHNHENVMLALTIATRLNWGRAAERAITEFLGLPHRLQYVGQFGGVHFLNDSKATAIDSVLVAWSACQEKLESRSHLWILLGGRDKKLPWEQLKILGNDTQTRAVFFGECSQLAKTKSGLAGESFENLKQALAFVLKQVKANDIVLLSPGGTSLDEFKNFEARGEFFTETVKHYFR